MEIITRKDPTVIKLFSDISHCSEVLDELNYNIKPSFGNERYLTDRELSKVLKISRRTLQEYRNQGIIPYFHLGGKIIYKESEIEKLLENSYIKMWEV